LGYPSAPPLVPVCRGANPEPYWLIMRLRRCLSTWAPGCRPWRSGPQGAAPARLVEVDLLPQARRWRGAHCRHPGRARRRGAVIGGRVRAKLVRLRYL